MMICKHCKTKRNQVNEKDDSTCLCGKEEWITQMNTNEEKEVKLECPCDRHRIGEDTNHLFADCPHHQSEARNKEEKEPKELRSIEFSLNEDDSIDWSSGKEEPPASKSWEEDIRLAIHVANDADEAVFKIDQLIQTLLKEKEREHQILVDTILTTKNAELREKDEEFVKELQKLYPVISEDIRAGLFSLIQEYSPEGNKETTKE